MKLWLSLAASLHTWCGGGEKVAGMFLLQLASLLPGLLVFGGISAKVL